MRRISVGMAAACLVASLAVAVPGIAAPARTAATTRTAAKAASATAVAYQEDTAHDGHSDDPAFVGPLTKLWSVDLGGSVWYPLIVGDQVFVDARDSADGHGTIVEARSLSSGQLLWGPTPIGGTYGFGGIAYDGGRLFALNGDGDLSAFDADTGARDWTAAMPGQYSFTSSPTAYDGTVYVSGAGDGGMVYAVSEADGTVKWTQPVENGDSSSPAVDASGIYVGYACEQAYSFSFAGALRWHHSTSCEGGGGRTVVLHDGVDYVRDDAGMAPAELSEADGSLLGTYTSTTEPAFDGSTMVTLTNGTLDAIDLRDGSVIWHNSSKTWTVAPLTVNGYVVAGAADGTVALLDEQTGDVDWSGSAGVEIDAPDEHNAEGVVGMAEAGGALAVPSGTSLAVFTASAAPRARITQGPANGSFVRSQATFRFHSNAAGAAYDCTLDAETVGCRSPFTVSGLANGRHTFAVAVDGYPSSADERTFEADRAPPMAAVAAFPTRFTASGSVPAAWRAVDAGSGVWSFDVRERHVNDAGSTTPWRAVPNLTGTRSASTDLRVPQRTTTCLSVRARDKVGNVSRWSPPRCITGLIDDRLLTAPARWFRGAAGDDFDGTFTGTDDRGATLKLPEVVAGRIAVLAVVCPSCGSIVVRFGKVAERFSLKSRAVTGPKLFGLPRIGSEVSGTLLVRSASHGRPVEIDAVGIAPS